MFSWFYNPQRNAWVAINLKVAVFAVLWCAFLIDFFGVRTLSMKINACPVELFVSVYLFSWNLFI